MTINRRYKAAIASVRNKGKATRTFTVAGMQCEAATPFYDVVRHQIDGLREALDLITTQPTLKLLDPDFVDALTTAEQLVAKQCVWDILRPSDAN